MLYMRYMVRKNDGVKILRPTIGTRHHFEGFEYTLYAQYSEAPEAWAPIAGSDAISLMFALGESLIQREEFLDAYVCPTGSAEVLWKSWPRKEATEGAEDDNSGDTKEDDEPC